MNKIATEDIIEFLNDQLPAFQGACTDCPANEVCTGDDECGTVLMKLYDEAKEES